jgi:hypothetical protein
LAFLLSGFYIWLRRRRGTDALDPRADNSDGRGGGGRGSRNRSGVVIFHDDGSDGGREGDRARVG